jgi:hypothetical protein
MRKPANLRVKAFQRYQEWLLRELVDEILFWSGHARNEGWLAEAVQSVAKIDPNISEAMVEEAMRLAIKRNRETIASNKRWITERREANEWIERALHRPRCIEVMASPEIAALLSSWPSVPSDDENPSVILHFKPRHTAE